MTQIEQRIEAWSSYRAQLEDVYRDFAPDDRKGPDVFIELISVYLEMLGSIRDDQPLTMAIIGRGRRSLQHGYALQKQYEYEFFDKLVGWQYGQQPENPAQEVFYMLCLVCFEIANSMTQATPASSLTVH